MLLAVHEDMYVGSIIPEESGMSCFENMRAGCQRGGREGQTTHFQKLLHISLRIATYNGKMQHTIYICPWRKGWKTFQYLRDIGIGTIRVSMFLSVPYSEPRSNQYMGLVPCLEHYTATVMSSGRHWPSQSLYRRSCVREHGIVHF